jgi:hypothetical protein
MTKTYKIDPPQEPSPAFLNARKIAVRTLQEQFGLHPGGHDRATGFTWIKVEVTWPSFDHLTFGYRNKVFSILVDLVAAGQSSLSQREISRCTDAARESDLVPCVFSIDAASMRPVAEGWNLRSLLDGRPVDPVQLADGRPTLMSEWELRNFAIQVVRNHIQSAGTGRVGQHCDVVGIDPQVWFEDASGRTCWIIVRHCRRYEDHPKEEFAGFAASNAQLQACDGYLARVSAASGAAVLHDLDGNITPLSRRFDGSAPLYRGDGFYVRFEGLERIHVA